jgi:Tfp pilus assembly protein PilO
MFYLIFLSTFAILIFGEYFYSNYFSQKAKDFKRKEKELKNSLKKNRESILEAIENYKNKIER